MDSKPKAAPRSTTSPLTPAATAPDARRLRTSIAAGKFRLSTCENWVETWWGSTLCND
jgi:hypothetical protein